MWRPAELSCVEIDAISLEQGEDHHAALADSIALWGCGNRHRPKASSLTWINAEIVFVCLRSSSWGIGEERHMPSDLLVKISNIRAALMDVECLIAETDLRQRRQLAKTMNDVAALATRIASIHCDCRRSRTPICSLTGIPLDPI